MERDPLSEAVPFRRFGVNLGCEQDEIRRGLRGLPSAPKPVDAICTYCLEHRAVQERSGHHDESIIRAHLNKKTVANHLALSSPLPPWQAEKHLQDGATLERTALRRIDAPVELAEPRLGAA